jgi:DNA-binding NarL/FixJ family response regulator
MTGADTPRAVEVPNRPLRVLVVDDYEPFRRFVSLVLNKKESLRIIGEAQDGLEAVRQAEILQPDLIVLDIGLPNLSGIDAARGIRKLVPDTRIVFVTQESSSDLVQEAFSLGAWGYVLKSQAAHELPCALDAAVQGREFVSHGLKGHVVGEAKTP